MASSRSSGCTVGSGRSTRKTLAAAGCPLPTCRTTLYSAGLLSRPLRDSNRSRRPPALASSFASVCRNLTLLSRPTSPSCSAADCIAGCAVCRFACRGLSHSIELSRHQPAEQSTCIPSVTAIPPVTLPRHDHVIHASSRASIPFIAVA